MIISRLENNCNNFYNCHNTKFSQTKISFEGAKENFGKILTNDLFQNEYPEITNKTYKSIITHFKQAISDIISSDNLMGTGHFGRVYRIDDNFVMKIDKQYKIPSKNEYETIKLSSNKFSDLKTYYGADILTIGNAHILKNAGEHIPAGVPRNIKNAQTYYKTTYLPTFANVPQESYDAIAKDFSTLNKLSDTTTKKYYKFDYLNPSNIVLVDNKLKLVDKIYIVDTPNKNTIAKLLQLLLNSCDEYINTFGYGEHVSDARTILYKILIASEKVKLPIYEQLRSDDKAIITKVLYQCNIKPRPMDFCKEIIKMREENPDTTKRMEKFIQYLNETIPIKHK